jgi:pimeloyl-ACP methyl ester carboxylesterase
MRIHLAALALIVSCMLVQTTDAQATEIEAPGPLGPLRGAMAGPATADRPVVLIVPGSGPSDRDGNMPSGIRPDTLKLLAKGLAARNITSVRIDKRGLHSSRDAVADASDVTLAAYADDLRSWIGVIRQRIGAPCIWILGHNEGGLVAMKTALTGEPGTEAGNGPICGLVLAGTPGRPIGQILRDQFRAFTPEGPERAPVLESVERILGEIEAGHEADLSGVSPELAGFFNPSIQPYMIDLLSHDPAEMIAAVDLPVLIVQGSNDVQVSIEDAQRLADARPGARLVILDGATHVLKTARGNDRAASLATYQDPELPLASGLVEAVAGFVSSAPARATKGGSK